MLKLDCTPGTHVYQFGKSSLTYTITHTEFGKSREGEVVDKCPIFMAIIEALDMMDDGREYDVAFSCKECNKDVGLSFKT